MPTKKKKNDVRYRICTPGQLTDDDFAAPTVHSVLVDSRRLSSGHSFRTWRHFFCTPRQSCGLLGQSWFYFSPWMAPKHVGNSSNTGRKSSRIINSINLFICVIRYATIYYLFCYFRFLHEMDRDSNLTHFIFPRDCRPTKSSQSWKIELTQTLAKECRFAWEIVHSYCTSSANKIFAWYHNFWYGMLKNEYFLP